MLLCIFSVRVWYQQMEKESVGDMERESHSLNTEPPRATAGLPPPRRCGVGLMLEQDGYGKPIFVAEVVAGGPSDRGGQIRKGDELVFVEGVPIARLSGEELSSLIGGLEGTGVLLGLERNMGPGQPVMRFEAFVNRCDTKASLPC